MGGRLSALQLESTNLQQSKNAAAHRTNSFIDKDLIVRRGQPFSIDIKFNRPVQSSDNLILNLVTGSISLDLPIQIPSSNNETTTWKTSCTLQSNTLTVTITAPVSAVIGCYAMTLSFTSGWSTASQNLGNVYVLFNPWEKGDPVYMENEDEKKEYVLNETGVIFTGNTSSIRSRPWDFAQFEEDVLKICLKILDSSNYHRRDPKKDESLRNDPIHIGRVLSAMMNVQDDNGVLVGNWSGDYEGGERPTKWNGSYDILCRWMKDGPVQFGQCWVFAGVLCTGLRCLGIPARVVTNFASAHDTNENLIVDRYVDEDGVESPETSDSIWNFHVWVEAWFARSDIGAPYDGWQVLDATPQEESEGIYCLGPCSVEAIRLGDVDLQYDAPFVFAEMNADAIDWVIYPDKTRKKIRSNARAVGKLTSTKAINSDARVDVTNKYKHPEGSTKERETFQRAQEKLAGRGMGARRSTVAFSATDTAPPPKPDFNANFKYNNDIQIGQNVTFSLDLKNTIDKEMTIQVKLTGSAIVYTNASVKDVLTSAQSVKLGPKEEKSIPYTIPYTEYENALTPDNMLKMMAVCEDEKGGKLLVDSVIILKNPPIMMKVIGKAQLNKPVSVEITITNTTPEEAHDCVMTIEGSGLVKDKLIIEVPKLKKNQKSVNKVNVVPYRDGPRCLMADCSSDKFTDVKGSLPIHVAST